MNQRANADGPCACLHTPYKNLADFVELGVDERHAEVTVLVCRDCGQYWLRYFYEQEAFTASGRWYLGAVKPGQLFGLLAEDAKTLLEGLEWYYYGGSFYDGRSGKTSGAITDLSP